jgi:hypothetical protein
LDAYRERLLMKSHSELLSIVSSFGDHVPASTPPDDLIRRILDYYHYSSKPAPLPNRHQGQFLIGGLLFLGIACAFGVIFLIIFIAELLLWQPAPICDSNSTSLSGACRPCPIHANCSSGRISCASGFVAVENLCAQKSEPMRGVLGAVLRSTSAQAGRYLCGLERRDSLTLAEIEATAIETLRNTTEAMRILPEIVAILNMTESGIQIRPFGKSKLFVSRYPAQTHLCAAYSALKRALLVAELATVCLIDARMREKIAEIWSAARYFFPY